MKKKPLTEGVKKGLNKPDDGSNVRPLSPPPAPKPKNDNANKDNNK